MKEPRADATLKNLPEEAQEELWELLHPADPEQKPLSVPEVLVEVPLRYGITVAKSAFYEWRSWYSLRRRLERARARARQAELEAAASGDLDAAAIARVGQAAFTAEAVEDSDVKAFVQLERLRIQARALDLDRRRIELLEAKARRLDEIEAKAREIQSGGGLSPEALELLEKQLKLL